MRVLKPYCFLLKGFFLSIAAILCENLDGLCLSLCVMAGILALEFLSLNVSQIVSIFTSMNTLKQAG